MGGVSVLSDVPWSMIESDPVLAKLILEAVDVLERIDAHMGVPDTSPADSLTIKAELRRIAHEYSGKR